MKTRTENKDRMEWIDEVKIDDGWMEDDVGQMLIDSLNMWVLIDSLNLCRKAPVSQKEPMNHESIGQQRITL